MKPLTPSLQRPLKRKSPSPSSNLAPPSPSIKPCVSLQSSHHHTSSVTTPFLTLHSSQNERQPSNCRSTGLPAADDKFQTVTTPSLRGTLLPLPPMPAIHMERLAKAMAPFQPRSIVPSLYPDIYTGSSPTSTSHNQALSITTRSRVLPPKHRRLGTRHSLSSIPSATPPPRMRIAHSQAHRRNLIPTLTLQAQTEYSGTASTRRARRASAPPVHRAGPPDAASAERSRDIGDVWLWRLVSWHT